MRLKCSCFFAGLGHLFHQIPFVNFEGSSANDAFVIEEEVESCDQGNKERYHTTAILEKPPDDPLKVAGFWNSPIEIAVHGFESTPLFVLMQYPTLYTSRFWADTWFGGEIGPRDVRGQVESTDREDRDRTALKPPKVSDTC